MQATSPPPPFAIDVFPMPAMSSLFPLKSTTDNAVRRVAKVPTIHRTGESNESSIRIYTWRLVFLLHQDPPFILQIVHRMET